MYLQQTKYIKTNQLYLYYFTFLLQKASNIKKYITSGSQFAILNMTLDPDLKKICQIQDKNLKKKHLDPGIHKNTTCG